MTETQVVAALNAFGIEDARIDAPISGYRNTSYAVKLGTIQRNLLVHSDEPQIVSRIMRTNTLGLSLHASGLPVRYPVDNRILEMKMGAKRYAVLYNYLPGTTIPWEAYTMKHIKLIGWAMARLHQEMAVLDTAHFPIVYDEYSANLKKMGGYFSEQAVEKSVQRKLGVSIDLSVVVRLHQFLELCSDLPESQLLHMDLVRGNVLFDEAASGDVFVINDVALTGVIDFEKAAVGHPLMDIARTLSFLLVDCGTKSQSQIYSYFLRSGYIKRGLQKVKPVFVTATNGASWDVLETAVDLFLLYDFYKFLRSNPYESLLQNFHYVRTVDLLIQRKILGVFPT